MGIELNWIRTELEPKHRESILRVQTEVEPELELELSRK